MIKIEYKHECKSYFMKDEIFDSSREKEKKISIFGIVLFKKIEHFNCDLKGDKEGKNLGFK